jgi:hypothetical protein
LASPAKDFIGCGVNFEMWLIFGVADPELLVLHFVTLNFEVLLIQNFLILILG